MSYADDEPVPLPQNKGSAMSGIGKVKLLPVIYKDQAPLEETKFQALVELKGERSSTDRPGVDIVTVLDVSVSMKDDNKLEKLKLAMHFLIRKLDPIDRLSIVTFSTIAKRLCRLRQMTKTCQSELEKMVDDLKVEENTNIKDGLEKGLQVLKQRKQYDGRVGVIMLMSDGQQNAGGDAATVQAGNVAVHTFGFGKSYDSKVLNAIANNSTGGTFSFVDVDNLSAAFSQCLGGLLTVVAQDLKITLTPLKGIKNNEDLVKIEKVLVGSYKSVSNADGSITVSFGDLYAQETRKFLVNLLLLRATKSATYTVLKITGSYSYNGSSEKKVNAKSVQVQRVDGVDMDSDIPEKVIAEVKRQETIETIKKAIQIADKEKTDDAKDELIKAQSDLEDSKPEKTKNGQLELVFDMLIFEVRILKNYMDNPTTYKSQGRPFALATITCHDRQRFAARIDPQVIGPNETILRVFATPRMDAYLEQAKDFDKNPNKALPPAEDDAKAEVAEDPLAPFAGSFSYYLEIAINALQAIQEMLKPPSSSGPKITEI